MDEIKQAIVELVNERGLIKPHQIVDAARSEDSVLHSYFCWDDTEAAEKWREEQARQLLKSIRLTVDTSPPVSVRAFISLPTDRVSGEGYRRMEEVLNNDFMVRQLFADIEARIEKWEALSRSLGAIIDFSTVKKQIKRRKK
jgi:hypothetical protein